MIRVTIYLLACVVGLSTVMGKKYLLPAAVDGYKYQCQSRGNFEGACAALNVRNERPSGFRCDKLVCAKKKDDNSYEAVDTGLVLDGTECGVERVCIAGTCAYAGESIIPIQRGPGPQYKCDRVLAIRIVGAYPPPTPKVAVFGTYPPRPTEVKVFGTYPPPPIKVEVHGTYRPIGSNTTPRTSDEISKKRVKTNPPSSHNKKKKL